jgi:hypothetical protein
MTALRDMRAIAHRKPLAIDLFCGLGQARAA